MKARKIRRHKRAIGRPFDFSGRIDLTYEEIVADLDPGMLRWNIKKSPTGRAA